MNSCGPSTYTDATDTNTMSGNKEGSTSQLLWLYRWIVSLLLQDKSSARAN